MLSHFGPRPELRPQTLRPQPDDGDGASDGGGRLTSCCRMRLRRLQPDDSDENDLKTKLYPWYYKFSLIPNLVADFNYDSRKIYLAPSIQVKLKKDDEGN